MLAIAKEGIIHLLIFFLNTHQTDHLLFPLLSRHIFHLAANLFEGGKHIFAYFLLFLNSAVCFWSSCDFLFC